MPFTSVRRDVAQMLIGKGYTDPDYSTPLLHERSAGVDLKPGDAEVGDG